jgi:hypothetical protein
MSRLSECFTTTAACVVAILLATCGSKSGDKEVKTTDAAADADATAPRADVAGDGALDTVPPDGISSACPNDAPTPNPDPVQCAGSGHCEYGQECCCGDCFPSILCECTEQGVWGCYYTEACMPPTQCEDVVVPDVEEDVSMPDTPADEAAPDVEPDTVDPTCEGTQSVLVIQYPEAGIDLVAVDPEVKTNSKGVVAFTGTSTDGTAFWLGRDGDFSDGAFQESKSYDAAYYPYHMVLDVWPAGGDDCEGNPKCETYYGLSGTWNVKTVAVKFSGTFEISTITQQENCWTDDGPADPAGCPLEPGTVSGCFVIQ